MASFNTIVRGDFKVLMEKLYDKVSARAYAENKQQWKAFYTKKTAPKSHVVRVADIRGFGLIPEVKENAHIPMFATKEGYVYEAEHRKFGGGFRLSQELIDDNRYMELGPYFSQELGKGAMETKEYEAVMPFNNGHSTFKFPDGQAFFSTAHKGVKKVTISNTLDTPAQISETTLRNMELVAANLTDDNGKRLRGKPSKYIIPEEMKYDFMRVARSEKQAGTANNDMNAFMYINGKVPVVTNQYLTHPGRFFMMVDKGEDACLYQRKPWKTRMIPDYTSESIITVGSERYLFFIRNYAKFVSNGAVT